MTNPSSDRCACAHEGIQSLYFHFDNLLHTRVNNLLVAESILFLAAIAVWSHRFPFFVVAVSGLLITALFTFTAVKLYLRVSCLIGRLKAQSDPFREFLEMRGGTSNKRLGPLSRLVKSMLSSKQPRWMDSGWLHSWGLGGLWFGAWVSMAVARYFVP